MIDLNILSYSPLYSLELFFNNLGIIKHEFYFMIKGNYIQTGHKKEIKKKCLRFYFCPYLGNKEI